MRKSQSVKIKESWTNKDKPENKKRLLILAEYSKAKKGTKWKKNLPSIEEKILIFEELVIKEFKNKNFEKIKDNVCKICGFIANNNKSFISHIVQTHNILIKNYYDFFIKKPNEGKCEICGQDTRFGNYTHGYTRFCSMKCVNNDPKRLESLRVVQELQKHDENFKKKRSEQAKKQWKENEEYIKLMTTPGNDVRKKQSKSNKERYKDPTERKKTSNLIKKAYIDKPELRVKASNHAKKLWADPNSKFNSLEYLENRVKLLNNRPTKPEKNLQIVLDFLKDTSFIYTGDGTFWINRKNPDFVDKKNKKIIEIFGDYYHSEKFRRNNGDFKNNDEHIKERINHFKESGYDCIVIWEHETFNFEQVIEKIKFFIEGNENVY